MSRSQCRDVNIVESLLCILPNEVPDSPLDEDLPHPDIKNAFISPKGTNSLVDLWVYYSNPTHNQLRAGCSTVGSGSSTVAGR